MREEYSAVLSWVKNWSPSLHKRGLLLFGAPGTGKTSTVYEVAKELGLTVVEYNASDRRDEETLMELRCSSSCRTLEPVVFLLDEADGIENWELIAEVLKCAMNPVILTCNDVEKIPRRVREMCEEIHFRRPDMKQVVRYIREKGGDVKLNLECFTPDWRQAQLSLVGSQGYVSESNYLELLNWVKNGTYEWVNYPVLVTLLDNTFRNFTGVKAYFYVKAIALADMCGRPHPLRMFQSQYPKIEKPYFFEKKKLHRR